MMPEWLSGFLSVCRIEAQMSRKVDALVHGEVMKLKFRFEKGEPCGWDGETNQPLLWAPNDYVCLNTDGSIEQCLYIPGGHGPLLVPKYSTDISAAFQVVERMRADGHEVCIVGIRDEDWRCEVYKDKAGPIPDFPETIVECASTAPMAICLAALAALGVEVPKEDGDAHQP